MAANRVRPGAAAPRIHDVAKAAGVSSATVSRVINDHPTVTPELAARVRAAVEATGYVRDPAARALRRRVADTWSMIVPDIANPFFTGVVRVVEDAAFERGVTLVLADTDERLDRERRAIDLAVASRVAGIVCAAASETGTDLGPALRAGIPVVLIDRRVAGFTGDAVYTDDLAIGRLAGSRFAETGRRAVACLAGPDRISTHDDRLAGLRGALRDFGAPLRDELVRRVEPRSEAGGAAIASLLDAGAEFDAVFAANGMLAAGAYRALRERGLAVPGDVAVIGADDMAWTSLVTPSLTVIAQPIADMGRAAAARLAARAAGDLGPAEPIVLAPQLIVRDSG